MDFQDATIIRISSQLPNNKMHHGISFQFRYAKVFFFKSQYLVSTNCVFVSCVGLVWWCRVGSGSWGQLRPGQPRPGRMEIIKKRREARRVQPGLAMLAMWPEPGEIHPSLPAPPPAVASPHPGASPPPSRPTSNSHPQSSTNTDLTCITIKSQQLRISQPSI